MPFRLSRLFRRERLVDSYLPLFHHLTDQVVLLDDDSLLAFLEFRGLPWETRGLDDLEIEFRRLISIYNNVAHESVVCHKYRCRGYADPAIYPKSQFRSELARTIDTKYREWLFDKRLYDNSLFYGVQIRASRIADETAQDKVEQAADDETSDDRRDRLEGIISYLTQNLAAYRPRRIGVRRPKTGGCFSEIAEVLVYALTGRKRAIPLTTGRLGSSMLSERIYVGWETIEFQGPGDTWFAAAFGMRHYPKETHVGLMNRLLSSTYCCTLYQSFRFVPTHKMQSVMNKKKNAIIAGNSVMRSQVQMLSDAADALGSTNFVMGDHCLTLLAFAPTTKAMKTVATNAWVDMSLSSATIAREGIALEAALFSTCPGNLHLRPRPGYISSLNMACFESLHAYPTGERRGYWGDPFAIFRTISGEAYFFHAHVNDVGNIFVCGRVGSGKTVMLAFLIAQSERFDATCIVWDKDYGLKIFIISIGGIYLELDPVETGLAPLKRLDDTPEDRFFLIRLIRSCILSDGGGSLTADQDRRLALAVRMVMQLPREDRWMEEVVAFLGVDENGAGARLEKWCWGNEFGGIIDCPEDRISFDAKVLGFDQTKFIDNAEIRGQIIATIYHYSGKLIDGRNLVFIHDEFWKALIDKWTRDLANDELKTFRKLNVPIFLATQSPHDALASEIGHTIREQCPTKIFFSLTNPQWSDLGDEGFGLTETEFDIVRELPAGSGDFLIKQDDKSVKASLPLQDMQEQLSIMSGREQETRLFDRIMKRVWAEFHRTRKQPASTDIAA